MMTITRTCFVLLLAVMWCEGHVLKKRQAADVTMSGTTAPSNPSTTPIFSTLAPTPETQSPGGCSSELFATCTRILAEFAAAVYAKATDEHTYAQNLCSKQQEAITCLEDGDTSECPAFSTLLDAIRFQFQATCQREGSCRLAESLFCFAEVVADLSTLSQDVCQNLQSVTSCAENSLTRRGCTPQSNAARFWAHTLISLEPACFMLPSSTNPPPCNFPFVENLQCQTAFNQVLPSLYTSDASPLCGEVDPLKTCLRTLKSNVECEEAGTLIERIISLFDRVVFGICTPPTPPSCGSHGNVYTIVPNTQCVWFTQSVNGYVAGTQSCPLGTQFDTSVCVCNHRHLVQCDV